MIALGIVLFVFLLLLLAPRRSYPWAVAVAVPAYTGSWWIIGRPLPSGDDWGSLDRAIISIALVVGVLPALCRFLLDMRRRELALRPDLDWRPAQVSIVFVAIWGVAWLLTPAIPILAGPAICFVLGIVLTVAVFVAAQHVRAKRVSFNTAGTALAIGMLAVAWWPMVVTTAAERRAAGRPYCLMIAQGDRYRMASTLLDLTPLVMRGREGGRSASTFHGELLIAGKERRNWSYDRFDFFDQASDFTPPHCDARPGFARTLAWM